MKQNQVYIIIVNWNGWEDTLECLISLKNVEQPEFKIILLDNNSTNESLPQLKSWILSNFAAHEIEKKIIDSTVVLEGDKIAFLQNNENYGFAKGNNIGIRYALEQNAEYVFLLNNDTVVEPDFLELMLQSYSKNPALGAVIPQIKYHFDPELIWNCGGKIFFGFRKYLYGNKPAKLVPPNKEITISYATGCALLFKPQETGLLTEKYFFGEEDFEFAYRMKKLKKKMICVTNSIIYHKVGRSVISTSSQVNKGTILIHYLNRFINMRDQFSSKIVWNFWRVLYTPYIILLLGNRFSFNNLVRFLYVLYSKSNTLNAVSQEEFQKARTKTDYFN